MNFSPISLSFGFDCQVDDVARIGRLLDAREMVGIDLVAILEDFAQAGPPDFDLNLAFANDDSLEKQDD